MIRSYEIKLYSSNKGNKKRCNMVILVIAKKEWKKEKT